MNAKKICALALSLGLSVSCAPKSDAGLIKDAAKVALGYAGYKALDNLILKYGRNYSQWWQLTKKKGEDFVTLIKGYIGMGVNASIKFTEEEIKLLKESKVWNKYFGINNINNINNIEHVVNYAYVNGNDEEIPLFVKE